MSLPTTALTADGHLLLTTEAGTIVLTHAEAKTLSGRLSMDLSALNWRHLEGEYPHYVTPVDLAEEKPKTPTRRGHYYVSTVQGASVVIRDGFQFVNEARAVIESMEQAGNDNPEGYGLVVRETSTGLIA